MDGARAPLTRQDSVSPRVNAGSPEPSMTSSESQQSTEKQPLCRRCLRSSLPYIRDGVLMLTAAAVGVVTRRCGPAAPGFFCQDGGISYPYRGDSVTVEVLAAATALLPLMVVGVVELVQERRGWGWSWRRPLWLAAVLSIRHLVCQACLFAVTEVIKCLVSRPRPCFLELCRPTGYNQTRCDQGLFISTFECAPLAEMTAKQRLLVVDSMLSFPSGHAAMSTCTATFLAVYLLSRCGGRRRAVLRLWLLLLCSLYAAGVSFSRVSDFRHHLTDVLAGMALGAIAGAALSYGVCADKLFARRCQRPLLITQTSVISNRTTDTQATSIDEEL